MSGDTMSAETMLSYYADRQVAEQWRPFLAALAGELFENLREDEARGFLRQVGSRVADLTPLEPVDTLEAFEARANKVLAQMDWGVAAFAAREDRIGIVHQAYPHRLREGQAPNWPTAFSAVLEGLYTGWLRAQGAGLVLSARSTGLPEPGRVDLCFSAAAT